ncbi:MAG TPA: GNAT family N-acetyltransferase [Nocardioidaceae bacterium]|nr:GNAT family N-acetyltransferase [Nocardioidaceae bacterium]
MAAEIRLAREDELSAAGAVVVDAYRAGGFLDDAEKGYAAKLADTASRARDAELYVAVSDGTVVGCVTYCPFGSPWGEIAQPGEGEFRMLGVASSARGQGIGLALTELCLSRSRDLGYAAVVLSSLPAMTAAHRMYERLGFVRLPERDWEPQPSIRLWAYRLTL